MTFRHYPRPAAPAPVSWLAKPFTALLCGLLVAGCAGAPEPRQVPPTSAGDGRSAGYLEYSLLGARSNDVLIRAIGLVGTPYRYGGNTPQGGFDCSGLVDFVFLDAAGLSLPRSTRELIALDAPSVDRGELLPGDLLYFNPGGGAVSHIGIYVGEDRFVHAPSTGGTVRLDVLAADYWRRAYHSAKRVLR